MSRIGRFSVSSYGKFLQCPMAWKFTYIDRIKRDQKLASEPMRFGSVIHAGLEAAYKAFVKGGMTGSLSQVESEALHAIREAWVEYEMPEVGGERERALGMMQDTLERMEADHTKVVGIEHKFLGVTPGGTAFIGFADRLDRPEDDLLHIVDYKVKRKYATEAELRADVQGGSYGHFGLKDFPWARRVRFSHVYPNHDALTVTVDLTPAAIEEAVGRLDVVAGMIETADEFNTRVGDHCGFCDYRAICPAWAPKEPEEKDAIDEMLDF